MVFRRANTHKNSIDFKVLMGLISFVFLFYFNNSAQANKSNFAKAPYLIFSKNQSEMVVLWQLKLKNDCKVYISTDSLINNNAITNVEYNTEHQHEYIFKSLKSSTKYFYKIISDSEVKQGSFHSRPINKVIPFSFIAYGDTRTNPEDHDKVAKQILKTIHKDKKSQTFIVSTGDVVADGDDEDDWKNQFFDPQYKNIQKMLANMPYMVSMGNHEGQGELFAKYFPYNLYQNSRYYYSYDYADVHFIAIDQLTNLKPGSAQYLWLENDLKNSKAKWNIVFLHKPGWAAGGHSNNKDVQKHLQPLFEKYNVNIVLAGHNHYYSRAVVNGIQHITTGGGGAPLYTPKKDKDKIVKIDKSLHFCKISIDSDKISIKVIRANGSVIEEFSINSENNF